MLYVNCHTIAELSTMQIIASQTDHPILPLGLATVTSDTTRSRKEEGYLHTHTLSVCLCVVLILVLYLYTQYSTCIFLQCHEYC